MSVTPRLWSTPLWAVDLTVKNADADALSDCLGEEALALTCMSPPRQPLTHIEALFDQEPDAGSWNARLAVIAALHKFKPPTVSVRRLPKLDWLKKVAEDFPPLPIGQWVVYGAQHKHRVVDVPHKRRRGLQIDATSAFGTGEHPTTRGCLLMLDKILRHTTPHNMLDVGCGSGILAMAFLKSVRNARATGIDMDALSVMIATSNARTGGMASRLRLITGKGYKYRAIRVRRPYDLIMANIFAGPLRQMAAQLKNHLKPGGIAILSGLLNHQANGVIAAHRMQGVRLIGHIRLNGWSVLAFKR
ncbi:MAG: 50S ribosomal protein L11 methyltransferase [Alphaproteobacteria bacterium]|nr:50S ribosomal protein L11 methyltransferase [Alphaproteobacteria bacterium]